MNILASQNIFNRFNTLVNFRGKKEQKTVSNPLTKDSTSEKIINSVATSNGKAQVTMQNKPVEITPELRSKVKEFAERFEVKDEEFLKIAQKTPEFLNRKLETLDKYIIESAKRFDIEKKEFVNAALKQPPLFSMSPNTLDKNITESAKRFDIEKKEFVSAALKRPSLFFMSPDTLDKNVTEAVNRFDIEKKEFVNAALKQPPLFCQFPDTLDKNVTESANRFDIKKKEFVSAALKQPSLFCQSPDTLDKNVTETAKRFDIEKKEFVNVALKRPSLFCLSPDTLERKAKIYAYYKELNNIPVNNLLECLRITADKHLLAQVLGVLINQQTDNSLKITASIKYNQVKEFLENNFGKYDLKIHNREIVTENLLEFAKNLEKELINKVKFNFKIIK